MVSFCFQYETFVSAMKQAYAGAPHTPNFRLLSSHSSGGPALASIRRNALLLLQRPAQQKIELRLEPGLQRSDALAPFFNRAGGALLSQGELLIGFMQLP